MLASENISATERPLDTVIVIQRLKLGPCYSKQFNLLEDSLFGIIQIYVNTFYFS